MAKVSQRAWKSLFIERRKQPRERENERPAQHLLSPEEQEREARQEATGVVRRYLRLADVALSDGDPENDHHDHAA